MMDHLAAILSLLLLAISLLLMAVSVNKSRDSDYAILYTIAAWPVMFVAGWIFLTGVLGWHLAPFNRRAENVVVEPIIVSELKLRNVKWQVFRADLVERTNDTALENAPKAFNRLRVDRTDYVLAFGVVNGRVREVLVQALVADPLVGAEQANLVRNGFVDEALKGSGAHVGDNPCNDIALALDSASNDGFAGSGRSGLAVALVPMLVLGLAADEGFVDFNDAAKLVHVLLNESGTDTMTHIPSGFVRAEAHCPHDLERGHTLFAGEHHVGDAVPVAQGLVGVLEDGSGNVGEAVTVCRAGFALPMEAGCQRIDLGIAAARTFDAIGPAASDQIRPAGILIRESFLELGDGHLMNWAGLLGHGQSSFVGGYSHG